MNYMHARFETYPVNELRRLDRSFKISREIPAEDFLASIERSGVLEPPVVLDANGENKIIFGFNRIDAAQRSGVESIICLKLTSLSAEEYADAVSLKIYRGDTGPVGRLVMIDILKKNFSADSGFILKSARGRWGVPEEFITNDELRYDVLNSGAALRGYLDLRDIGYKTIKILCGIPRHIASSLGEWAAGSSMRVNIFKSSVEMMYEIIKRDGLDSLDGLAGLLPETGKEIEGYLFNALTRIRYPEHSALAGRVESVVKRISAKGLTADFPLRTENDHITLSVSLGRKRDLASAMKSMTEAAGDIEDLLKMI